MMKLPIVTGSMNTEEERGRFEDGRKLRAPGRVALTNRLLSWFQKLDALAQRALTK
ncbi:hypothetical protein NB700_004363 [Xanthomonas sacchari]|uniref:Transposase n=1 Tax=Xanthomonas sacchari TaxID=56458 RepID=A0ABT3E216_9XANT|nr:hypothetical protein [Xanthomonas sacchari]